MTQLGPDCARLTRKSTKYLLETLATNDRSTENLTRKRISRGSSWKKKRCRNRTSITGQSTISGTDRTETQTQISTAAQVRSPEATKESTRCSPAGKYPPTPKLIRGTTKIRSPKNRPISQRANSATTGTSTISRLWAKSKRYTSQKTTNFLILTQAHLHGTATGR